MNKPREFTVTIGLISNTPVQVIDNCLPVDECPRGYKDIHVIEKSAYQDVVKKLEIARSALKYYADQSPLGLGGRRARKALEEINDKTPKNLGDS